MKDLPEFKQIPRPQVEDYIAEVLTNRQQSEETHLLTLVGYSDGHYRAIFDADYFVLSDGREEPSKSQWNTLKKKLKRHRNDVFVFKDYGEVPCEAADRCYYVDFGFFAD